MVPPAQVRVLEAGVYNNPAHRSLGPCKAGDVITVAGGAYVDSLIEDGLVELFEGADTSGLDAELEALEAQLKAAESFTSESIDSNVEPAVTPKPPTPRVKPTKPVPTRRTQSRK